MADQSYQQRTILLPRWVIGFCNFKYVSDLYIVLCVYFSQQYLSFFIAIFHWNLQAYILIVYKITQISNVYISNIYKTNDNDELNKNKIES